MSSIGFHSPQGTVSIHGPERANAHILCSDLLVMALGIQHEQDTEHRRSSLRRLVPGLYQKETGSEWIHHSINFLRDFELYIRSDSRAGLIHYRGGINAFHAALNTAIVAGSDPIRLLARIDAQCELHGYVEGKNRAWLAGIVEEGIAQNILRTAYDGSAYKDSEDDWWGWQRLVQMLQEREDEPVVMSHSSGDHFPNLGILHEDGQSFSQKKWYALSSDEQWEQAMTALRHMNESQHLEISPDALPSDKWGNGLSGYDLRAMLDDEIVRSRSVSV